MEALLYKLRGCHDLEAEEVIVIEKMEGCLLNKVMKEVECGRKNCDFSWSTIKSIADRRLVAVLGVTLMVKIVEIAQKLEDISTDLPKVMRK